MIDADQSGSRLRHHRGVTPRTDLIGSPMSSSMSRTTTSVVAVVAGIVLLSAAGGSFAEWSDGQTIDGGEVTSGSLAMTVSPGEWYDTKDASTTSDDVKIDPATFRIVPGDTIEYRATVTPELVGDNIEATLATDIKTVSGTLASSVTTSATLNGDTAKNLTPADTGNGTTYAAVVKVVMPETTPGGANAALDLSTMKISLKQTH